MYSRSPTLNQVSLKNFIWKVIFRILVTCPILRSENSFLDRNFETQHVFNVLFVDFWLRFKQGFHGTFPPKKNLKKTPFLPGFCNKILQHECVHNQKP